MSVLNSGMYGVQFCSPRLEDTESWGVLLEFPDGKSVYRRGFDQSSAAYKWAQETIDKGRRTFFCGRISTPFDDAEHHFCEMQKFLKKCGYDV